MLNYAIASAANFFLCKSPSGDCSEATCIVGAEKYSCCEQTPLKIVPISGFSSSSLSGVMEIASYSAKYLDHLSNEGSPLAAIV